MGTDRLRTGRPYHEQISNWLRARIEEGGFAPDDQLPSESDLGKRFGVSRITVRRALQTLESEGLIYRRQGLGSFVAPGRLRQGLVRLTDFAQDMARAGAKASSRVLHHGQEVAPAAVSSILGCPPDARVVRLDRLRLGDGLPVAFDRTWLPLFYGQVLEGRNLDETTIYQILEEQHGIPVLRGRYRMEAMNAPADIAGHLDVPKGCALFVIGRLSLTVEDRPVYFQRRFYRCDRVAFEMELAREAGASGGPGGGMPLREFEPVFQLGGADD